MKNMNQIVNTASPVHISMGIKARMTARMSYKTCLVLSVLVTSGTLTACGQRGALYMPTAPAAADRASLVETITQPKQPNPASKTAPNSTSPAPVVKP